MRPIVFFDIEATGTDVAQDRIVTLAAVKMPDLGPQVLSSLEQLAVVANPGFPMSDEVVAVHGITNERAAQFPPFGDSAERVMEFFKGCDLAGFNLLNFDVPILWEELYRNGHELDLSGVRIIDAGNIFKKKEERTLAAAVRFYTGGEHTGAHDALADVEATINVLVAQRMQYPDLGEMDLDALAKFSRMEDRDGERVDLVGKIVRRKSDGVPVYNFGKAKGVPVTDDPGFGWWMLRQSFVTAETKSVVRRLLMEGGRFE